MHSIALFLRSRVFDAGAESQDLMAARAHMAAPNDVDVADTAPLVAPLVP